MPHQVNLITTIAVGLGLAMILGLVAARLKMPPLIGYLVAGIAVGPATPGFVADVGLAGQLAEIGVMLMMFGVGLHLSMDDLLSVKRIAVPGAVVQIAVATTLGGATALVWGWDFGAALVFGLALSVASTVVLLRALEPRGLLNTVTGRIAVGWLVVEDLAVVLVLVMLPPLASLLGGADPESTAATGRSIWLTLAVTAGKVVAFVVVMLVFASRLLPRLLWIIAKSGSRELFTLGVIATAVGVAYGASRLFSVSFALGAFVAGMVVRESALSHRVAEESLPLRDAFSVLFFVSVGMLFDPRVLLDEPLRLLAVLAIIVIGKTLAAIVLVLMFRYSIGTALTIGAALAQIGEFSFILASLGISLGLLPEEGQTLILAASLVSIAVNPAVFASIDPVLSWIRSRPHLTKRLEGSEDPLAELPATFDQSVLSGHVVIVGYGRVGRRIAETLDAERIPYVVAEQNRETVERLRDRRIPAVAGNAAEPMVLVQAHVARAAALVIAVPEIAQVRPMVETARALNPKIEVLVRTHSDDETEVLRRENIGRVFMGEHELAGAMSRELIGDLRARQREAAISHGEVPPEALSTADVRSAARRT